MSFQFYLEEPLGTFQTMFGQDFLLMDEKPEVASQEGFMDRLVYTFTTDKKVGEVLGETLKKLNGVKPEDFDSIVVDKAIYDYKTLADIVKYCDITVEAGKQMVKKMDRIFDSYTPISDAKIRELLDEIYQILDAAGEEIIKKVPNRDKFQGEKSDPDPATKGKTLKDLGYTVANMKTIIQAITKNLTGAKAVCSSIKKYSEKLPLASLGYRTGHAGLLVYSLAGKAVKKYYNNFTYFFFWLGRHLEK